MADAIFNVFTVIIICLQQTKEDRNLIFIISLAFTLSDWLLTHLHKSIHIWFKSSEVSVKHGKVKVVYDHQVSTGCGHDQFTCIRGQFGSHQTICVKQS